MAKSNFNLKLEKLEKQRVIIYIRKTEQSYCIQFVNA